MNKKNSDEREATIGFRENGEGFKRLRAFKAEKDAEIGVELSWQQALVLALAWWTPKDQGK